MNILFLISFSLFSSQIFAKGLPQTLEVSGRSYRCVDKQSGEDLDEDLQALPGETIMVLLYNEYPKNNYLIPTSQHTALDKIAAERVLVGQNGGYLNNQKSVFLEMESGNFGGNFTDVLEVTLRGEGELLSGINVYFLCEPVKASR